MTAALIAPHTSTQIAILRPLCIFFMLYVHVNPGFDPAIHSGAMLYFGIVVVDILGRTSVAALSLVSGFLLAYGATRKHVGTLMWGRIQALYLPMLVWSGIFIFVALAGSALLGHPTATSRALEGLPVDRLIAENLMFLHGTPANPALGFLRDLTASSVLLAMLLRISGKAVIWIAMLAVFGVVLFGTLAPLIFRPTILLFMLAGAALYRGRGDLNVSPIFMIVAAFLFTALAINHLAGPPATGTGQDVAFLANAAGVVKRATLAILALSLGGLLVTTQIGTWLRGISDGVFLTYLCHTTVISILWAGWKHEVGNEVHWAYPIFFTLSPVLVMALATCSGPLLNRLPRLIQIGLRGKARTPAMGYNVGHHGR